MIAEREALNGFGNPNFKALTFDHQGRLWTGNFAAGIYCYDIDREEIIFSLSTDRDLQGDRVNIPITKV